MEWAVTVNLQISYSQIVSWYQSNQLCNQNFHTITFEFLWVSRQKNNTRFLDLIRRFLDFISSFSELNYSLKFVCEFSKSVVSLQVEPHFLCLIDFTNKSEFLIISPTFISGYFLASIFTFCVNWRNSLTILDWTQVIYVIVDWICLTLLILSYCWSNLLQIVDSSKFVTINFSISNPRQSFLKILQVFFSISESECSFPSNSYFS